MAKKAKSNLPNDDFTPTFGSAWGLDSFYFDGNMNEGVMQKARLPEVKGMSTLPDGFLQEKDPDIHISMDTDESKMDMSFIPKSAGLVNLEWLDATQDPKRLPKSRRGEERLMLDTLESAWSANVRTDGVFRVPAKDRETEQYRDQLTKDTQLSGLPGQEDPQKTIRLAMRQAHALRPLKFILRDLKAALGDTPLYKAASQNIKDDYGLAGNVYIRASAFPGLTTGKWAKELSRCKSASYALTDNSVIAAQLGLPAVTEIPWKAAFNKYASKLELAGKKVASEGSYKERLRGAFLASSAKEEFQHESKPTIVDASDSISLAEAKTNLANSKAADPLASPLQLRSAKKRRELIASLRKLHKQSLLSEDQFNRLAMSSAPVEEVLKVAYSIISKPKTSVFAATGEKEHVMQNRKDEDLSEIEIAAINKQQQRRKAKTLMLHVKAGTITEKQAKILMSKSASEIKEFFEKNASGSQKRIELPSQNTRTFEGSIYEAAPVRVASEINENPMNRTAMLAWVRRQMASGLMGSSLTQMIKSKWAKSSRIAAKDEIAELRKKHEGLSGVEYVDAGAYASKKGDKGCDDGALIHRGNMIKYLVPIEDGRCEDCIFAKESMSGKAYCTKYGKKMISSLPNSKSLQARNIKESDAPDYENIAAMFNPKEYKLESIVDSMVEIPEETSTETLSNVLYGDGMSWDWED